MVNKSEVNMGCPLLGVNDVHHIGIVVNNLEKALPAFLELLGCEPPPIKVTLPLKESKMLFRGKASEAQTKKVDLKVGANIYFELLEPDKNENSTWRQDLDKNGEGIQHIAFVVKNIEEKKELLKSLGYECVQMGEFNGGRYAYFDTNNGLKMKIEVMEYDE